MHELRRGEILKKGELARPGALECVQGLKGRFELSKPDEEGARRAALAQWLTAPENPLTWRSSVNRIWHYHFGRGIVNTPGDFLIAKPRQIGGKKPMFVFNAHNSRLERWAEFVAKRGN